MSLFRSGDTDQTQPDPVAELLAQAREDYAQHNSPATQAAAREQSGQTRTNGNAAGGGRWGR
ncbi:hypothetical protein [Streptomyces sp. CA2R106]|uniref:hypothetical protein n=1 Tax=Streptomyces sp. CA2R106 TaxID=3120153 RepID=UPI0030080007